MRARDAAELARAQQAGERLKFLFFRVHRPPRGGGVGRGCLSRWWEAPFTVEGEVYRSAEHHMMAEKARLFGDEEARRAVPAAAHPGEAKDLGRRVRGFDEAVWAEHRYGIVVRGSRAGFARHPDPGGFLPGTGERVLVGAGPLDRVRGVGPAADDERTADVSRRRGSNLLGFALMDVREEPRGSHHDSTAPARR